MKMNERKFYSEISNLRNLTSFEKFCIHFFSDLVKSKRRPVIVWIHGGNFVRGTAADYEPDYILDEDVVLVTIQYRLGMFGFLSTEDASAPGNYGMLDQVAALQWVKTNIESFSGDPNRYVNK